MNRATLLGLLASACASVNATVLFDNGPFVTGVGNGYSGANTSAWTVFNTSSGPVASNIGCNANNFRVIEDFTVPAGEQWTITRFTSFAFRSTTGQQDPPISNFSQVKVAVYTTDPRLGGSIPTYGNLTDNRYESSSWTGAYRIAASAPTDRTRAIMAVNATTQGWLPTLSTGRYWIEFGLLTTSASSPVYAVGVSPVPGDGDALQRAIAGNQPYEWAPVTTAFKLEGTSVPEPSGFLSLAVFGGAMLARRKR